MTTTRRSLFRWAGAAAVAAVAERLPLQADAPNDIRITEVRPLIIKGRTLFVMVKASNGMFGLGECSPMNMTVLASNVQTLLKPRLMGKDPFKWIRSTTKCCTRTSSSGPWVQFRKPSPASIWLCGI
jgi:hypothetical protein